MKSTFARVLCGIGAAVSAAYLLIGAGFFKVVFGYGWFAILYVFQLLTQINPFEIENDAVCTVLSGMITFLPAALYSGLLWFVLKPCKHARTFALSAVGALTALVVWLLYNQSYRYDPETFWTLSVAAAIGSFGCIGCILLYEWLQKKLPSVFNRETVSYIIFGVLTTVVSFVSQMLFSAAGFPVIVNTIGSWICAVIFAYVVNKLFVFESKTDSAKAFLRELGLFIGARVASLGMELVFMLVTVELLHFNEAVCKLIAQVFILVANYVFSKLVIFRKAPTDSE